MHKQSIPFYQPNTNKCLVNLSCSILKYFNVPFTHPTIPEVDEYLHQSNSQKIVLLLFDGLGKSIVEKHLNKETSFLRQHQLIQMDSVFPPTTVAATTALLSGKFPIETGWLGWIQYFKSHNAIYPMFNSAISEQEAKYENILSLIRAYNNDVYIDSFWPAFKEHNNYSTIQQWLNAIGNQLDINKKCFIYGYWDQPDFMIHKEGTCSKNVNVFVNEIDCYLKEFCLKYNDTTFLVIADHSLIDMKYIILSQYQDVINLLERPISIEERTIAFHIKNNKHNEFVTLFNKYFSDKFVLLSKEEVLKKEIFGKGTMYPICEDAIGDYIAISIGEYSMRYKGNPFMVAGHAGGTEEEFQLYLFAI
jgi:predicted AlkP superfamily pyrophosphatase or phosphodiesterase